MVYGFYPKQKAYVNKETIPGHYTRTEERDIEKEELWHKQLLDAGFEYNEELDFYYSKDGALMADTDTSIEEYLAISKYAECIERGYDVSYGDPTPLGKKYGHQRAIYCKNYQEIISNLVQENENMRKR